MTYLKKKNKIISITNLIFNKIGIIDLFLIVFMCILLAQSSYNLINNEINPNLNSIDTVVRTTTAGLFGYFMGKNFVCSNTNTKKQKCIDNGVNNLQIIIIAIIGIVSLIILIYARNVNLDLTNRVASLSQLRDFVSSSTGFLISNSKKN